MGCAKLCSTSVVMLTNMCCLIRKTAVLVSVYTSREQYLNPNNRKGPLTVQEVCVSIVGRPKANPSEKKRVKCQKPRLNYQLATRLRLGGLGRQWQPPDRIVPSYSCYYRCSTQRDFSIFSSLVKQQNAGNYFKNDSTH